MKHHTNNEILKSFLDVLNPNFVILCDQIASNTTFITQNQNSSRNTGLCIKSTIVHSYVRSTIIHFDQLFSYIRQRKEIAEIENFINQLFEKNWDLIKNTMLCYTAVDLNLHPGVYLALKLTKKMLYTLAVLSAKTFTKDPLQLLIPTLKIDIEDVSSEYVVSNVLNDGLATLDTQSSHILQQAEKIHHLLQTHILISDATALQPVSCILDDIKNPHWHDRPIRKTHLYDKNSSFLFNSEEDEQDYYLTEDEKQHILNHSAQTIEFVLLKQQLQLIENQDNNLLTQLQALCDNLLTHSKKARGTELKADDSAELAIALFCAYYNSLPQASKDMIAKELLTEISILRILNGDRSRPLTEDDPIHKIPMKQFSHCISNRVDAIEELIQVHATVLSSIRTNEDSKNTAAELHIKLDNACNTLKEAINAHTYRPDNKRPLSLPIIERFYQLQELNYLNADSIQRVLTDTATIVKSISNEELQSVFSNAEPLSKVLYSIPCYNLFTLFEGFLPTQKTQALVTMYEKSAIESLPEAVTSLSQNEDINHMNALFSIYNIILIYGTNSDNQERILHSFQTILNNMKTDLHPSYKNQLYTKIISTLFDSLKTTSKKMHEKQSLLYAHIEKLTRLYVYSTTNQLLWIPETIKAIANSELKQKYIQILLSIPMLKKPIPNDRSSSNQKPLVEKIPAAIVATPNTNKIITKLLASEFRNQINKIQLYALLDIGYENDLFLIDEPTYNKIVIDTITHHANIEISKILLINDNDKYKNLKQQLLPYLLGSNQHFEKFHPACKTVDMAGYLIHMYTVMSEVQTKIITLVQKIIQEPTDYFYILNSVDYYKTIILINSISLTQHLLKMDNCTVQALAEIAHSLETELQQQFLSSIHKVLTDETDLYKILDINANQLKVILTNVRRSNIYFDIRSFLKAISPLIEINQLMDIHSAFSHSLNQQIVSGDSDNEHHPITLDTETLSLLIPDDHSRLVEQFARQSVEYMLDQLKILFELIHSAVETENETERDKLISLQVSLLEAFKICRQSLVKYDSLSYAPYLNLDEIFAVLKLPINIQVIQQLDFLSAHIKSILEYNDGVFNISNRIEDWIALIGTNPHTKRIILTPIVEYLVEQTKLAIQLREAEQAAAQTSLFARLPKIRGYSKQAKIVALNELKHALQTLLDSDMTIVHLSTQSLDVLNDGRAEQLTNRIKSSPLRDILTPATNPTSQP